MAHELAVWNAPALSALRQLIHGATDFTAQLQDTEVTVSITERLPERWPDPPPSGLQPSADDPWPESLSVRAEWSGGATDLRVSVSEASGRYEGLVGFRVETRTGGLLLWLSVPSVLAKLRSGVADLCLLTAVTKRQDNTEQNQALASVVRNAGMPFGTRKKVSIGRVSSSGELLSEPLTYWRNLIIFCLLKLPFYSSDPRDFDGLYFLTAASREHTESAGKVELETVIGTSHAGLMIPVLEVLSHGPQDAHSIEQHVLKLFGPLLTPGDHRRKRDGRVLWRYNTRWALSFLKQRGEVENPARSRWSVTTAGLRRLEREHGAFDLRTFQTLHAKVLSNETLVSSPSEDVTQASIPPAERSNHWHQSLVNFVDTATLARLSARIRPDLGPSPTEPIARNVIFVGPPGTGKTWLAEKVAHALTGEQPTASGAVRARAVSPELWLRRLRLEHTSGPQR